VLDVRAEDESAAGHLPRPATAMGRRGACARIRRQVAVQPLPGQRGPSFVSPSVCAFVIVRLVIAGDAERPVSRGQGGGDFSELKRKGTLYCRPSKATRLAADAAMDLDVEGRRQR
jgi:hypothetical protein